MWQGLEISEQSKGLAKITIVHTLRPSICISCSLYFVYLVNCVLKFVRFSTLLIKISITISIWLDYQPLFWKWACAAVEEILDGGAGRRERKVSLLQLSPFFAFIFPPFPLKRLLLRLGLNWTILDIWWIRLLFPGLGTEKGPRERGWNCLYIQHGAQFWNCVRHAALYFGRDWADGSLCRRCLQVRMRRNRYEKCSRRIE